MRTLSVLLFCYILPFISTQYDNQHLSFQPIPVILKFPDGMEQGLKSLQYPLHDDIRPEIKSRFSVPVNGIYDFNIDIKRYDSSYEVPKNMEYEEKKARNPRYQEQRYENNYWRRPGKTRSWQESRSSQQRTKRPRYSRKDVHRDDKIALASEVSSIPRVVTYVADQNGFALREDLVRPFEEQIFRSSRRKPRILTAGSSPLMSRVVTSAIRVGNGNSQSSPGGKYLPQVIDFKVGK